MKLNYKKYGEGEPVLIILHGLFGSLDNWHTLAQRFGEKFTVYSLDQRNHGKSPHSDDFSYELMSQDLLQFMDDHKVGSAVIMGHSMGGKTAMRFALDYPERVAKLIVVDMPPTANKASHETIFEGLNAVKPETLDSRSEADDRMGEYVPEQDIRLFLLKNLTRNESGGYKWKMNLEAIEANYNNVLAAISAGEKKFTKPTLFVYGGRSKYIDPQVDTQEIMKIFSKAELTEINNAGHWIHAEQPDLFFDAVNKFVGNTSASG